MTLRNTMIKNLILIRHAKSSWSPYGRKDFFGDDHQRPLNFRGNQAARVIGACLREKYGTVDQIFSSSALRASQTHEIIASHVDSFHKGNFDTELYTFDAQKLMAYIKKINNKLRDIIIIGHNPAIHEVCLNIIDSCNQNNTHANMKKKFPTCGTAHIQLKCTEWSEVKDNSGQLKCFFTPKSIAD